MTEYILYFILGMIVGILISIVNILAYKKEVQDRIRKFTSGKAKIIDTSNPLDNINL